MRTYFKFRFAYSFVYQGGVNMNRFMAGFVGALALLGQSVAFANVGEGPVDYSGITGMYYTLIGIILAYGVYDTFFKKS
jgi:hypothetical protein